MYPKTGDEPISCRISFAAFLRLLDFDARMQYGHCRSSSDEFKKYYVSVNGKHMSLCAGTQQEHFAIIRYCFRAE